MMKQLSVMEDQIGGLQMFEVTESQVNKLEFIIANLTVTGPVQGGYLNIASTILNQIKEQKSPSILNREVESE